MPQEIYVKTRMPMPEKNDVPVGAMAIPPEWLVGVGLPVQAPQTEVSQTAFPLPVVPAEVNPSQSLILEQTALQTYPTQSAELATRTESLYPKVDAMPLPQFVKNLRVILGALGGPASANDTAANMLTLYAEQMNSIPLEHIYEGANPRDLGVSVAQAQTAAMLREFVYTLRPGYMPEELRDVDTVYAMGHNQAGGARLGLEGFSDPCVVGGFQDNGELDASLMMQAVGVVPFDEDVNALGHVVALPRLDPILVSSRVAEGKSAYSLDRSAEQSLTARLIQQFYRANRVFTAPQQLQVSGREAGYHMGLSDWMDLCVMVPKWALGMELARFSFAQPIPDIVPQDHPFRTSMANFRFWGRAQDFADGARLAHFPENLTLEGMLRGAYEATLKNLPEKVLRLATTVNELTVEVVDNYLKSRIHKDRGFKKSEAVGMVGGELSTWPTRVLATSWMVNEAIQQLPRLREQYHAGSTRNEWASQTVMPRIALPVQVQF